MTVLYQQIDPSVMWAKLVVMFEDSLFRIILFFKETIT